MPKVSERRELLSNLQYLCACSFVDDDDEAFEEYSNMYALVISSRYLTEREGVPKSHDFLLHYLFTQPPLMFKQHVRTTREGFLSLVRILAEHEIFNNNSHNPQIDVAYQVAVCLMRLGSYGNGAALQHAQRTFGISKGTVVLYTTRVIAALCSVRSQWVQWPSECRRKEISSVMEKEGFPGCVGFVDGTTLPLHQKPGIDGQSYFDRKHRYSISLQVVCDVDRRIISFLFGWPGSTHDDTVYKACDLFKCPANYFSSGQYILSDSAYPRSDTIIPCYRSPAALCPDNLEFNYCVAHSRVRNEHCIGILKGRFSSLRELRKPLNCLDDIVRIRDWVTACVVLHNMLAHLGDAWAETFQEEDGVEESGMGDVGLACNHGDCPREKLKEITLRINRQRGFLPIA